MKAEYFDRKFDDNEVDIIEDLDLTSFKRPNQTQKRVNVDFPSWIIDSLDKAASKAGVTRQSIIKVWLVERLEAEASGNIYVYDSSKTGYTIKKDYSKH